MSDEWVLAGRYRVDAPIGSGGMGEVWRGYDEQLDRRIAIKLMHSQAPLPLPPGSPEAAALAEPPPSTANASCEKSAPRPGSTTPASPPYTTSASSRRPGAST